MGCRFASRQQGEQGENFLAVLEIAAGDFADDKIMDCDDIAIEKLGEMGVARTQVVDPDRGVNQNHTPASLRRGISLS